MASPAITFKAPSLSYAHLFAAVFNVSSSLCVATRVQSTYSHVSVALAAVVFVTDTVLAASYTSAPRLVDDLSNRWGERAIR